MAEISYKNKWLCERGEISLREEINFLPGENKFLCGRKNISLREKINLYTGTIRGKGIRVRIEGK